MPYTVVGKQQAMHLLIIATADANGNVCPQHTTAIPFSHSTTAAVHATMRNASIEQSCSVPHLRLEIAPVHLRFSIAAVYRRPQLIAASNAIQSIIRQQNRVSLGSRPSIQVTACMHRLYRVNYLRA